MRLFARLNTQQDEAATQERLTRAISRLRHGAPLSDAAFDEIFPAFIRNLSRVHWTPIEVIRRAVSLLVTHPGTRILDVGSGVGKFCMVGALISEGRFFGIEQRKHFVELANHLSARHCIARTTFQHGDLSEIQWQDFDAIYLFNPFQENKTPDQRLDDTVPLSRELYLKYVSAAALNLEKMPQGARVVTYHGFGGSFPKNYERKVSEWCYRGPLELWIKT
jgi:SAM-dependent methyltransferase